MKKNIIITGASGFVGSYLLKELLLLNQFNIIVLLRSQSNRFRIESLLSECKIYYIDTISLEQIFKENSITGIIHLATYYKKTHEAHDIEEMITSNITFPTKLVELASQNKSQFFINTGTFFEYSMMSNPIKELSQIAPFNLYASTKIGFDSVLKYYALNSSLNIMTLKLSAPFGYNDNLKLIPFLINSLLDNKEVILEKGEQEWDFIYVKDVVSAFIKTIEFILKSKRTVYEEVLIGMGKKTSVKEIVNILNKIDGNTLITCKKEYPCEQIFEAYIDNSKAKNLLQWVPRYSIKEALEETFSLYKENKK